MSDAILIRYETNISQKEPKGISRNSVSLYEMGWQNEMEQYMTDSKAAKALVPRSGKLRILVNSSARALLCAVIMLPAYAQDTIEVVSTGYGLTHDDALRDALRTAVSMSIGQLVDAETIVKNDEVIHERVLNYSGGYVDGYDLIQKAVKRSDGLLTTRIRARVRKTALMEKLKAENVTSASVHGASLFAEMLTRQQEIADAVEMLRPEFEHAPGSLVAAMFKQKPNGQPNLMLDPSSGGVSVNIEVRLQREAYKAWIRRLVQKCDDIAMWKEKRSIPVSENIWNRGDTSQGIWQLPKRFSTGLSRDEIRLLIVDQVSEDMRSLSCNMYIFEKQLFARLQELLNAHLPLAVEACVTLLDSSSGMIGSGKASRMLDQEFSAWPKGGCVLSADLGDSRTCYAILPLLAFSAGFGGGMDGRLYISWDNSADVMTLPLDLGVYTPEQLRRVERIDCLVTVLKRGM